MGTTFTPASSVIVVDVIFPVNTAAYVLNMVKIVSPTLMRMDVVNVEDRRRVVMNVRDLVVVQYVKKNRADVQWAFVLTSLVSVDTMMMKP